MNIQQLKLERAEALEGDQYVNFYFGPSQYLVKVHKSAVEEWVKYIAKTAAFSTKLEPANNENPLFKGAKFIC